jgi:hypothetical protein
MADAADVALNIKGIIKSEDLDLTASGVNHVIILGAGGPLHPAAHGIEFGEFKYARFRFHVDLPSWVARVKFSCDKDRMTRAKR